MQGNGASPGEDHLVRMNESIATRMAKVKKCKGTGPARAKRMSQESVRAYLRETILEADVFVHRPQEIKLTVELLYLSGLEQLFRNPRFNTAT